MYKNEQLTIFPTQIKKVSWKYLRSKGIANINSKVKITKKMDKTKQKNVYKNEL